MSLVQNVLIAQSVKVLALATLLSLLIKKPLEHDPVIGPSLFMSEESERVVSKPSQEDELRKKRTPVAKSETCSRLKAIKSY